MFEWLTIVYFVYIFLAFYFLFIYVLTFIQNKHRIYEYEEPNRIYPVSIVVPCFNAEKIIERTVATLLASDYQGLKKIILVDDCSTDRTYAIIKKLAKKHRKVIAVQTPKNTGKASGAKNYGAKFVKTEFIGFTDDDSIHRKDAVGKMVGFFNDSKVGAVTSRVLVHNRINKLTKAQAIEYKVITFTRKLLGFLDAIYVTNGPLSIYRTKGFREVGGFDTNNWTEDIELTWALVSRGWKIKISIPAKVYTEVPSTVKAWFKQRIRWNVGGIQTVVKYRKKWFQCGMLGYFIMPFFVLSWLIGISGLFFLGYRISKFVVGRYLITKHSLSAQVALINVNEFSLNPSLLFFFGMVLFALSLSYLFTALFHSKEKDFPRHTFLDIFIYSIFYLLMYPPILIYSFYKFVRGLDNW